jgi:hypothetical protein
MSDKTKKAVEKAKGKKAKVKKLDKIPEGTKAKKLPKDVAEVLAEAFPSADFKKVRVHVGGDVADACKGLQAKAFTIGNDIYFGKASDSANKELLAHELTHVVQQGNTRIPKAQKGKALVSK